MAKDFNTDCNMSKDTVADVRGDTGGDLAGDVGVDLNKAMSCDMPHPPPEICVIDNGTGSDQQEELDERIRMINDGMGPGPESNVEQYPESESAENCDPPDDSGQSMLEQLRERHPDYEITLSGDKSE